MSSIVSSIVRADEINMRAWNLSTEFLGEEKQQEKNLKTEHFYLVEKIMRFHVDCRS